MGRLPIHALAAGIAVPEGSPMRCPRCDADTPDGTRFCIECGLPLRPLCPQCGVDILPRAKFCGECDTPLTAQSPAPPSACPPSPLRYTPGHVAEKILPSKNAREGERKQVMVLFADLKGSMALLADRDSEDARQLLDPVLERLIVAVHCDEGAVNQVLGDGMMALFDAPIILKAQAMRVCSAVVLGTARSANGSRPARQPPAPSTGSGSWRCHAGCLQSRARWRRSSNRGMRAGRCRHLPRA